MSFLLRPSAPIVRACKRPLSLAADNVEDGTFLTIVNGKVDMFKATMRLAVDAKWGKVEVAGANDKKPSWDVNVRRECVCLSPSIPFHHEWFPSWPPSLLQKRSDEMSSLCSAPAQPLN